MLVFRKHGRRVSKRGVLVPLVCGTVGSLAATTLLGLRVSADDGSGSSSPIQRIAHIPMPQGFNYGDGPGVVVDSQARRAVVVQDSPGTAYAFDLDSKRVVSTVSAPVNSALHAGALDPKHHRLFKKTGDGITAFDMYTGKDLGSFSNPGLDNGGGFFYSASDGILYAATGSQNSVLPFTIFAINPDSSPPGALLWATAIPQCAYGVQTNYQEMVAESSDSKYLFAVCQLQAAYVNGAYGLQGGGAIIRLQLPADPASPPGCGGLAACAYTGAVDLYGGIVTGPSLSESMWIPSSERILTVAPSASGWTSYVFDTHTGTFTSAPTLFQPAAGANAAYSTDLSVGIDPSSGVAFAHSAAYTTLPQRTSSGNVCTAPVAGSNAFTVVDTSGVGNRAFQVQAADPKLFGGFHPLGFDPVAGNLWMLDVTYALNPCDATDPGPTVYMDVFHVNLPKDEGSGDPLDDSARTADIPEVTGQTGANLGAQASSYGVRYAMAPSGTEGPLTNVSTGGSFGHLTCTYDAFWSRVAASLPIPHTLPPAPPQYSAFCHAGNRVATFAQVPAVSLDAAEVRADSIVGATDQATAQDLETATALNDSSPYVNSVTGYVGGASGNAIPPPCTDPQTQNDRCVAPDAYAPYVGGQALPYRPAHCDDGGQTPGGVTAGNQVQVGQTPPPTSSATPLMLPASGPGNATVECLYGSSVPFAVGQSDADQASLGIPIWAHDASSTSNVTRSAKNGTIATAHASADGINIGNVLHVGRIVVDANSQAHGRAGTAHATYSCVVSGLELDLQGQAPLSLPKALSCDDPQVTTVVAQFNHAFTGHLHIEFPTAYASADTAPLGEAGQVIRTTRHGYMAEVQQSNLEQTQNSILLSDNSVEQPGLVVTVLADTPDERDRFVASFAAVSTVATYGIFPLTDQASFDSGGDSGAASVDTGLSAQLPAPSGGADVPAITSKVPTASTSTGGGGIQQVAQAIVDGLRYLFQNPKYIPAVLVVWLLFASPAYLLSRRRSLMLATGGVG